MSKDKEASVLPETGEDQLALLKRLFDPEAGGKLVESDLVETRTRLFGDRAREAASVVEPAQQRNADLPTPIELTPEVVAETLAGLEKDYKRGIVVVDETAGVDDFRDALKQDKTAGKSWEEIKCKLEADDSRLLKEAAKLQGKGTLIGVYPDGTLCIKDRGNEPVMLGFIGGKLIKVTTDIPNRDAVLERITNEGKFSNYWERREAYRNAGLQVPPDAPDYMKKGVVAAAEAVTGEDFVRSANGNEFRSADLDCGNVDPSSNVRVVYFYPDRGRADVDRGDPVYRNAFRGAVRVLRG